MEIPSILLPRPPYDLSLEKRERFDQLYRLTPPGGLIEYQLPYPKWQYLTYLCENRDLVLHGSQNRHIDVVEPRQARDVRDFSSQHAIYATTDGIWVIYFAILDRERFKPLSLFNSCFQARTSSGAFSDPVYFFSISHSALIQGPWCNGMIYILPRQSFRRETNQIIQGMEIQFPHWVSESAAMPIARLEVRSDDFPFLQEIHGHDDTKLQEAMQANPNGFPWPEALIH